MPLAHSLSINLGLRYSDYTNDSLEGTKTSYGATTYKAELDYAPSRDIRFRASYNHAIRAPNVAELFAARGLGNVQVQDPCSGASPISFSLPGMRREENTATSPGRSEETTYELQ